MTRTWLRRAIAWNTAAAALSAAALLGAGSAPSAAADEWNDPVAEAVARVLALRRDAGFDDASWISTRRDEVTTGAGLARVDVHLTVTNHAERGLEWRRNLPVDPAADLIGAVYTRPDGVTTRAVTLSAGDAGRLYGRAVRPETGRDPMRVDRPERERLEIRIFPVPSGATVGLLLTFATPLKGAGDVRSYRDPLDAHPHPVTTDGDEPVTTPGAALAVALAVPNARLHPQSVLLRTPGLVPTASIVALSPQPTKDGLWIALPDGEDLPPVDLRVVRGTPDVATFTAGGYPILTNAFAWRLDPAALSKALGLESTSGIRLRLSPVDGSTSRLAPEMVRPSDEPTLVLGRAWGLGSIRVNVEALDDAGKSVAKRIVSVEAKEGKFDEHMTDALRAFHRARLVERVYRWAGDDEKRHGQAVSYAVDLGVVGRDVSAFAVPKDERGFMTRKDLSLYLTDGVPFDGDAQDGDFKPAPPGAVK